ncbi:helix-turn-helix transcriptional regulator [Herbidospora galbida]|uniref:Helix-turn-helix transcriptional regulator n=1 Tax=Herbidospora galbida TaxID=2575442 RepID=A0A4U3M9N1_9ACTN|nr:helix-turn-helix transcriptional regulator [Herbidospora galbida]TKK85798.1 helix-turn-helix transcriptional regulator [Herbidospora galbida]
MTLDGDHLPPDPEAFGPWLGRQLRRKGVSQSELAAALDVTRAAVSAWITGRATPRVDKIQAIEEFLNLAAGASATRDETPESSGYIAWHHREAHRDGGRELGNAAAFAFDSSLEITAREATQNSLDECHDPTRPVRVRFILHEISGERLRRLQEAIRWDELAPHIEAASDPNEKVGKQKVGRKLAEGLRELQETGKLLLLRIDDYNANGLTGDDYDDGRFAAVVRRQLDSHKLGTAGGSFGLGKATIWGASRFGLVIVNSTLSEPHEGLRERRVIGRIDLPWHQLNGAQYAGPAWLGNRDPSRETAARSWWAGERALDELYLRRASGDPGTSFLIVGAHDPSGEANSLEEMHGALVRGLATNFWASMVAGDGKPPMLEASVEALCDGQVVVAEERVDPYRYEPGRARAIRAFLDGTTVSRLTKSDDVVELAVPLTVPPRKSEKGQAPVEHTAVLLVTPAVEGDPKPNRLVGMRGTRMTVVNRPVTALSLGSTPFQAVLLAGIVGDRKLPADTSAEAFLRAAEPPEHNDWKATEDLVATYARGAATRLREFRQTAFALVRATVKPAESVESGGTPTILRDIVDLEPTPPARTRGYPTVKSATGDVDETGAWRIRVEIKLPERDDPWVLRPVLRFATRSGPKPEGRWAELVAESNCDVNGDILSCAPRERSAVFTGVSDVASHPVAGRMTIVEVDLIRAKEGGR